MTGSVGVALTGIDLRGPISEAAAQTIRDALFQHCVLIIRGQMLEPDHHLRLAGLFGEPFLPYYYAANALDGYPEIAVVPNFGKAKAPAEAWHTDWSHMSTPPTVSIAVGHVIPDYGGDTMFSNQYAAYDRLSDGMKALLSGRRATFVGSRPVKPQKMAGTADTLPASARETVINHHPIAREHPGTNRTALYLNRPGGAMVALEGFTEHESLPILQFLYDQSVTPDNVYRHQWQPGDVVCWDNRCAMHYGVHDYGDMERTLHRITVGGAE
ncbi:TauD/TfdA dioxygenase family protein [Candidatus Poriferisocius sp.]|uniref:TauD/TfdA dioxygenase family protein n=1 Tax=Candidatus Poriferisocius sp. TaxID=3101276 RepID=UPI003B5A7372